MDQEVAETVVTSQSAPMTSKLEELLETEANDTLVDVKKKKVERDNIRLNFFYKDMQDEFRHKCVSPQIQEDGRLDIWPEGFFDEWDKASFELF